MDETLDINARMGPNSIIQIGTALQATLGSSATRGLFGRAGLAAFLDHPPQGMVAEVDVMHLHAVLRQALTATVALRVAHDAGIGTGNYLLRHRIPQPAQRLLQLMPRRIASRLLVAAIVRHSWTFKGSGRLRAMVGPPPVFILDQCAICRGAQATIPLCRYYAATFERLFQELVHPAATVIETECAAVEGGSCRFEVSWG